MRVTTTSKAQTLSVGETAKRLDISPDSIRNYCERGWLHCTRGRGNHRRVLISSIESFESQRSRKQSDSVAVPQPLPQKPRIEVDFEIWYVGNEHHPNRIEPGYVCNLSFLKNPPPDGYNPCAILGDVGREFGGGTFQIIQLRTGQVISERGFTLPGPTKDDVVVMREIYLG